MATKAMLDTELEKIGNDTIIQMSMSNYNICVIYKEG